ncbi:MAG: hypothetical protein R3D46_10030 [Defluviimonas denitrificans]
MYSPEFDALLSALAALYRDEGRDEAARTAQALLTTPAPEAIGKREACAFDILIRDVLSTSDMAAARALLAVQDMIPGGRTQWPGR